MGEGVESVKLELRMRQLLYSAYGIIVFDGIGAPSHAVRSAGEESDGRISLAGVDVVLLTAIVEGGILNCYVRIFRVSYASKRLRNESVSLADAKVRVSRTGFFA